MSDDIPDTGRNIFVSAPDGLKLRVREYGARLAPALPVVCLPGLTRTVADFETLAPALAPIRFPRAAKGDATRREGVDRQAGRRVLAIDSRGRGCSEYDRNPANYNILVELNDVVAVLTALAVSPAVFVGSSRGGLLAMHLAVAHPSAVAGVVLHDIGPVIEPEGLARIMSYVGKLPQPHSLTEGADILRRVFHSQFPALSSEQWLAAAERAWQTPRPAAAKPGLRRPGAAAAAQAERTLVPTYDVRLARTLADVDLARPLPHLWNEFEALARVPIMVIRGEKSDVLSAATVAAMAARHPGMQSILVANQGHVPLLEGDLVARIVEFVKKCDAAHGIA